MSARSDGSDETEGDRKEVFDPSKGKLVAYDGEHPGHRARISRTPDGTVLGVPLFLSADDLEELGIDAATTDEVYAVVENGEITLKSAGEIDG